MIAGGFVDSSKLVAIREEGYRYAGSCVTVGVVLTALPCLVAAVALALALAYAPRGRGAAPGAGAGSYECDALSLPGGP